MRSLFWWRQLVCLFWAAKECRLHRRPRCLLTEILNEMSKRSVWNEVPFCAGGSLSVLLSKYAGFTRRPRTPASQAATLRVTEVLNEIPQRGAINEVPFLLEAACLFCRPRRMPLSQSSHFSLFLNEMLKRSVRNEIPFFRVCNDRLESSINLWVKMHSLLAIAN